MFYAIREHHRPDGTLAGYYVSTHEHDETPAVAQSETHRTISEARGAFERSLGYPVQWGTPDDPETAPDVVLLGND